MKSFLIGTLAYAIALAACSTSIKEVPTERRLFFLPSEELAKRSGTSLKELHIGFSVWIRECGKCHQHVFPDDLSNKNWHAPTPRKEWNANITEARQAALLKYMRATKIESGELSRQLEVFAQTSR